nr:hypothetical protein [Clostridium kluyveri]
MNKNLDEMKLTERLKHKIFFAQADMDFMFQYFMSNCGERGGAFGELFNVARRIDPKDDTSWKAEFVKEAEKIEALAEGCLEKGHRVSAGDAFLRAYSYYRAAFCGVAPGEKDHDTIYFKSTSCFRRGIDAKSELIPHEWVTVDYKGHKFPGCFFKHDNSGKPRPTIYLHNGAETHAEDHYFMYTQSALDRGYNCLILDGPWDPCGRFYAPDATYKFFNGEELAACWRAVTDMLLDRSDVDPKRLVVAGESYGGAKTMYHASVDDRFAAVIGNLNISKKNILPPRPHQAQATSFNDITYAYNFCRIYLVKFFTKLLSIWFKILFFKSDTKISNPIKILIYTSFKSNVKKPFNNM